MDSEVNAGSGSNRLRLEEETMNEDVRKEIEQLRREKTKALRARYLDLFGEESKSSVVLQLP
jgi:hypothetical protein